jgi:predicted ABC-type ATPase
LSSFPFSLLGLNHSARDTVSRGKVKLLTASRIFLNEIEQAIETKHDFAFETTLAGRGHLGLMRRLRAMGWRVELIYLAVPDAAVSMQRVAERVAHGGHDIPAADIARRFPRSLTNLLGPYSEVADQTRCFMNTDGDFTLIFEQVGPVRTVHHQANYRLIQQKAKS